MLLEINKKCVSSALPKDDTHIIKRPSARRACPNHFRSIQCKHKIHVQWLQSMKKITLRRRSGTWATATFFGHDFQYVP
jgi:hypothetical protein